MENIKEVLIMEIAVRKKFLCLLVAILLLGFSVPSFAATYQSVADLSATTPERWTQTYETKWRTVQIDVPIQIPKAAACPIVRVTRKAKFDSDFLSDYFINKGQIVCENIDGALEVRDLDEHNFWKTNPPFESYARIDAVFEHGETPDAQPEDNPVTYEQALQMCDNILKACKIDDRYEIVLDKVRVFSGIYLWKKANGKKVPTKHLFGNGSWELHFLQKFSGIEMESADNCYYYKYPLPDKIGFYFMNPQIIFQIWEPEKYSVYIELQDVIDQPYEDVPVCSFEDAKQAIEGEILAGHLRTITKCKFCYMPYHDSKDTSIVWLIPAWLVEGGYTRDAKKEFSPTYDEEGEYVDDGMEHYEVIFNANTGELIDFMDNRKGKRKVPAIVTWDHVH